MWWIVMALLVSSFILFKLTMANIKNTIKKLNEFLEDENDKKK